jgi:hypothetical protein
MVSYYAFSALILALRLKIASYIMRFIGINMSLYAEMFQKTVNINPFVCRKYSKGVELSCLYHPDRGGTFFDEFAVNQGMLK